MTEEIFIPVISFDGLYEISNFGRLKCLPKQRANNQILKESISNRKPTADGYIRVSLSKDGIKKSAYLHRLVAEHFIPNPCNLPEVNHKDGDKANCRLDNLEWIDRKGNEKHAWDNGLKTTKGAGHFNSKPIIQMDVQGNVIGRFVNSTDMTIRTGFERSVVQRCCRGNIKHAYGFKWSYVQ